MKRLRPSRVWSAIRQVMEDSRRELRRMNSLGLSAGDLSAAGRRVSRPAATIAVRCALADRYDRPSSCC